MVAQSVREMGIELALGLVGELDEAPCGHRYDHAHIAAITSSTKNPLLSSVELGPPTASGSQPVAGRRAILSHVQRA